MLVGIWKENQAETPTKNAKNKTKSGQNVEEAKTWLEEMGLSSMLQKQEEEEEEEEDEEEEEGEEEKRGKKRERKKKKPWEPRKRRGAMSSKVSSVSPDVSLFIPWPLIQETEKSGRVGVQCGPAPTEFDYCSQLCCLQHSPGTYCSHGLYPVLFFLPKRVGKCD